MLIRAAVHAADISDRDGAKLVLAGIADRAPALRRLWLNAGCQGTAATRIAQGLGPSTTAVRKPRRRVRWPADSGPPPTPTGFRVLPRRWVAEHTFAWLGRYRRLSKDYEALPAPEEARIHPATSSPMLARLARCRLFRHPLSL